MGKAPMPPAKGQKPKTTASDRVEARYKSDMDELAPGIFNRAMTARKYGEKSGLSDNKRTELARAGIARAKRDRGLVREYGEDAYKAKSFMSEPRPAKKMKSGGMVEGSAKDLREDKALAKKHGMSMSEWEKSPQDKKHDAPKKMAKGGAVRGTGCAVRGKNFSGTY